MQAKSDPKSQNFIRNINLHELENIVTNIFL